MRLKSRDAGFGKPLYSFDRGTVETWVKDEEALEETKEFEPSRDRHAKAVQVGIAAVNFVDLAITMGMVSGGAMVYTRNREIARQQAVHCWNHVQSEAEASVAASRAMIALSLADAGEPPDTARSSVGEEKEEARAVRFYNERVSLTAAVMTTATIAAAAGGILTQVTLDRRRRIAHDLLARHEKRGGALPNEEGDRFCPDARGNTLFVRSADSTVPGSTNLNPFAHLEKEKHKLPAANVYHADVMRWLVVDTGTDNEGRRRILGTCGLHGHALAGKAIELLWRGCVAKEHQEKFTGKEDIVKQWVYGEVLSYSAEAGQHRVRHAHDGSEALYELDRLQNATGANQLQLERGIEVRMCLTATRVAAMRTEFETGLRNLTSTELVGKAVQIKWQRPDGSDVWHTAHVVRFRLTSSEHLIAYDDGEEAWVSMVRAERAGAVRVLLDHRDTGAGARPGTPLGHRREELLNTDIEVLQVRSHNTSVEFKRLYLHAEYRSLLVNRV